MPGPGGGPVGTALTILTSCAEDFGAGFARRIVSVWSEWLAGIFLCRKHCSRGENWVESFDRQLQASSNRMGELCGGQTMLETSVNFYKLLGTSNNRMRWVSCLVV